MKSERTQQTDALKKVRVTAKQEEIDFRKMLPTKGFFHQYMQYTDKQESPGSFHFWTGASVISSVLQRRAWVSKGVYKVYPNLFIMLVAPSGICRKSRAISLGTDLLEQFSWMNIIADKTTPEALLEGLMVGTREMEVEKTAQGGAQIAIEPEHTGLIKAPELATFLNRQTYTNGMVALLTDLYDCKETFKYITRNSKPIILNKVALNMIAGSTPDWLASSLPEDAFGGGFMSRIIFMFKEQRDRMIPWPEEPAPDEREALRKSLIEIRALVKGKIHLEHDARSWFTDWYVTMADEPIEDQNLLGFIERKPDTILKIATILAASEVRTIITYEDMIRASELVTWTQNRAFKAFRNVDLSQLGQLRQKIVEFVAGKGGLCSRRDVLRKFGGRLVNGLADLKKIEDVMRGAGDLRVIEMANSKGRPRIMYTTAKVKKKKGEKNAKEKQQGPPEMLAMRSMDEPGPDDTREIFG